MRIPTCSKPNPYIQAATCHVERKEAAFIILRHLADLYELAMAVHIPNSHQLPAAELLPLTEPVHALFQASTFFAPMHEAFQRLHEFKIEYDPESDERCQICSLVNVHCMMASSPFCAPINRFISETAGDNPTSLLARINYDWTAALIKFQTAAKLPKTFRSGPQRIKRAIAIASLLYAIRTGTPTPALAEPTAVYGLTKVQPHCPHCANPHPEMCPVHQSKLLTQCRHPQVHLVRFPSADPDMQQPNWTDSPAE